MKFILHETPWPLLFERPVINKENAKKKTEGVKVFQNDMMVGQRHVRNFFSAKY